MNFSLFRHELKLLFQSRKNILFILFFVIAIFSYVLIILPDVKTLESFDQELTEGEIAELEMMQEAREGRRHTGGGYDPISFYSSNNYELFLKRGLLKAFQDENFERYVYLRTYYLYSILNGQIFENEIIFKDSPFPIKDRRHFLDKKIREYQSLLEADIDITYAMIEEKTALQTLRNVLLSFGPFLLMFSALYFSNDILVRDRRQMTAVQGLPLSWYRYLNTKTFVSFIYTIIVLIGFFLLAILLLTFRNGFGSFDIGVPHFSMTEDKGLLNFEYVNLSMFKFLILTFILTIIGIYIFTRLNMMLGLFLKNEWIVLILSSLLLFSERFYFARDKRELFNIGIDKFPQTYFEFGKIVTGEKNFLLNMEELTVQKGFIVLFVFLLLIELLFFLAMKIITKERFFRR